LSHRLFI